MTREEAVQEAREWLKRHAANRHASIAPILVHHVLAALDEARGTR